jgi:hypothetical protein
MKRVSKKAATSGDGASETYTAKNFEQDIPSTINSKFNRYLHAKLDRVMAEFGPFEAVCRMSKEVTGDAMAFPVVLGDRGCLCVPTPMLGHYGPDTHFWLGFAHLSRAAKKIMKVYPLPCFDEFTGRVEEIMKAAKITC